MYQLYNASVKITEALYNSKYAQKGTYTDIFVYT